MASVIFDFDSTLVPCESLEELCKAAPDLSAAQREEIEQITAAGMDGTISFEDSLRRRLALARPTRPEAVALGRRLGDQLTAGAGALVKRLGAAGHEVWIVSGGFREVLLEVGAALGLPEERVQGVQCEWSEEGAFAGLDSANGFLISKVEGLSRLLERPAHPSVGVGDGATDLALKEAGFLQHFIAYTEHARRMGVVDQADFEAANMEALEEILGTLLR